jgi:hypothetical protein
LVLWDLRDACEEGRVSMNNYSSVDTCHVWSLALGELLGADETGLCWLNEVVEALLATGVGAVEVWSDGPTTWHFVAVPAGTSAGDDEALVVVETTWVDQGVWVCVRPAFWGSEPTADWALAGVSS